MYILPCKTASVEVLFPSPASRQTALTQEGAWGRGSAPHRPAGCWRGPTADTAEPEGTRAQSPSHSLAREPAGAYAVVSVRRQGDGVPLLSIAVPGQPGHSAGLNPRGVGGLCGCPAVTRVQGTRERVGEPQGAGGSG